MLMQNLGGQTKSIMVFSELAYRVFRFSGFKKEIAKHFFCSLQIDIWIPIVIYEFR